MSLDPPPYPRAFPNAASSLPALVLALLGLTGLWLFVGPHAPEGLPRLEWSPQRVYPIAGGLALLGAYFLTLLRDAHRLQSWVKATGNDPLQCEWGSALYYACEGRLYQGQGHDALVELVRRARRDMANRLSRRWWRFSFLAYLLPLAAAVYGVVSRLQEPTGSFWEQFGLLTGVSVLLIPLTSLVVVSARSAHRPLTRWEEQALEYVGHVYERHVSRQPPFQHASGVDPDGYELPP